MARSIVLRFPAVCADCGRSLSAGTTARWFGRGRVSCCGSPQTKPGDFSPAAVQTDPPRQNGIVDFGRSARPVTSQTPPVSPERAKLNEMIAKLPPLEQCALDTGIPIEALASGLSQAHVQALAASHPNMRLLVRLSSGARFIVPTLHAMHVLACISESCRDKIRDVSKAAEDHR